METHVKLLVESFPQNSTPCAKWTTYLV